MPDDNTPNFSDLVAQKFFGAPSYKEANIHQREEIRLFVNEFYDVAADPELVIRNIEDGTITPTQRRAMQHLVNDPSLVQAFSDQYVQFAVVKDKIETDEINRTYAGLRLALDKYIDYIANFRVEQHIDNFDDYIQQQLDSVGEFEPFFDHLSNNKKIRDLTIDRPGKFRRDTPPPAIARYQCRIGGSTFLVPPTNIKVTQTFQTGSTVAGALRQPNTPKTNLGHSDVRIEMNLFFPNHESIWGFRGEVADFNIFNWDPNPTARPDIEEITGETQNPNKLVSDQVIDYFLSSLRGLVTQFKYTPFLPVRNEYLNRTYDISAVALLGMTVTTVPDFPFVLQVNLQMEKFNFQPFMPMIEDFSQAIHWGRFRQMCGKGAARMDAKVNQGFLVEKTPEYVDTTTPEGIERASNPELLVFEGDLIPSFNKAKDLKDGRNFEFYYPVTTPSRIFAPDTTDFRQPGEDEQPSKDLWDGILSDLGLDVLQDAPQFNFFEYDRAIKRITQERELLYEWLKINGQTWETMRSSELDKFLQYAIDKGIQEEYIKDNEIDLARATYKHEWFYALFDMLISNNKAFQDLTSQRDYKDSNYILNEWKVPMEKLDIDWDHCIVNGISVNLSNNVVKQQLQLQETPVHQHIGSGDSTVYVSMTVLGEETLIKIRRLFQHINGLARIEQAHGVLGFLGIKNVVTALCGVKYVLPLDISIDTVPGMPHVYSLNMSFVDFDVMQQEREKLSAQQQTDLIEAFGKRNPFLRIKQRWSAVNLYPDMPLDLRDETGNIIGHFDPDWYFRSFISNDHDIFFGSEDNKIVDLIKSYADVQMILSDSSINRVNSPGYAAAYSKAKQIEEELKELVNGGASLPPGWKLQDGEVKSIEDGIDDYGEAEMRQILGVYGDDEEKAAFIDFHAGGYMSIGTIHLNEGSREEVLYRWTYFTEDLASDNLVGVPAVPNSTPYPEYQKEYLPEAKKPGDQFNSLLQDFDYRNKKGRMLPAFPTYMLWLIDEGGQFAGIKLFDNFYGLNSVIDFSVLQSQKPLEDTLILRVSNIYNKLSTPYNDMLIREDDPLYETPIGRWITTATQQKRNLDSGLFSYDENGDPTNVEVGSVRLKPGVRLHLRAGYGANPSGLQTVFNGVITEVAQGDIMTIVAQSDAVELTAMVNSTSVSGHSGKIDGGLLSNFWMSEPRDLMVRLLSMGSSRFKEWVAWGSRGVIFSESRFGIRHFGNILYEEMNRTERLASTNMVAATVQKLTGWSPSNSSASQFRGISGDFLTDVSEASALSFIPNVSVNMVNIATTLWLNQSSKRDYEIYKRNIYPGNGTGIAQFMGGDMIDGGVIVTTATALYDTDQEESGPQHTGSYIPGGLLDSIDQSQNALNRERNKTLIDEINDAYKNNAGVTPDELLDIIEEPNTNESYDIIDQTTVGGSFNTGLGVLENILFGPKNLADAFATKILDFTDLTTQAIYDELGPFGSIMKAIGSPQAMMLDGLGAPFSIISTTRKLSGSHIGKALGLSQEIHDDDLYGYNEVAFRAQTYMKTVWDLFELCAALLPNYIVAVRPFEDRSTVFYGKAHWLYTSGVIPVSTGVSRDRSSKPQLEAPDQFLTELYKKANESVTGDFDKLLRVMDSSDALKDVKFFEVGTNVDPYNAGSTADMERIVINSREKLDELFASLPEVTSEEIYDHYKDWLNNPELQFISSDNLLLIINYIKDIGIDNAMTEDEFNELIFSYSQAPGANGSGADFRRDIMEVPDLLQPLIDREFSRFLGTTDVNARSPIYELLENDPITFAYQYGWAFSFVPAYIDPDSGFGVDSVGQAARKQYDESFSISVDAPDDGKSLQNALDVWQDFRREYRYRSEVVAIYDNAFPLTEANSRFDEVMDLFMRFLWQDPYNRAWVVNAASRSRTFENTVNPFNQNTNWHWENIDELWKQFLIHGDVDIDPNGIVQAASARRYITNNPIAGNTSGNFITGTFEDVNNWWDNNIGQMIGIINDTITGLVSSVRLSLSQLGAATSLAGLQQQQANILNDLFNNSRYYQAGQPGSLMRFVDNPFTREYGEPVIEVREPFQRVHYISSFDSIINNGIRETLNDVSTVVTAVSDGENPVTVHFDKGVPPDRQVETTVETGLYWDNVFGDGLLGLFQPLIHPLEALRGVKKISANSSDQLSSRRVALYHLKQNLQDIYDGEVIILGNPDIRPFDLIYIADVYERCYGFFEAAQVIHHFTPENGFITSITPNALVTINDPVRWSSMSYLWGKMNNYNLRNDVRASMGVKIERELANGTKEITQDNVYKYFSTQMQGSMQYTQGNNALIRDIGAVAAGGGMRALTARDEIYNKIATMDIVFGATKGVLTAGGVVGGAVAGGLPGAAIGGVGGFAIGDLAWEAWQWVKDNLLDQQGCYISYLTKDGEPMDAGLGYYKGVAAGTNHSISLFPNILGINTSNRPAMEDGHYRITTNDLLASIGWTEVDTLSLQKETSMYINEINAKILNIAGRGPTREIENKDYYVIRAKVLNPTGGGEVVDGRSELGVIDGDTIRIRQLDGSNNPIGRAIEIRLAAVNTYELEYYDNAATEEYDELEKNPNNDLGRLGAEYLRSRFTNEQNRFIAIRIDKRNETSFNRTVGTIFHNVPLSLPFSERLDTLERYASANPPIPFDSYMADGRPYTLNWEIIMAGYGNVDMRETLWNTPWRDGAIDYQGD